jgi:hypothetical protein
MRQNFIGWLAVFQRSSYPLSELPYIAYIYTSSSNRCLLLLVYYAVGGRNQTVWSPIRLQPFAMLLNLTYPLWDYFVFFSACPLCLLGTFVICVGSRSQCPRCLRHELFSPAPTLGSWIRIPLKAWLPVSSIVLFCVQVAALRLADPLSKEYYRV